MAMGDPGKKKTWKRSMTAIALLQNSVSNILRKTIWWMRSLSSKPAARSYLWKFSKVLLKKSNRVPTFEIRSPQHVRCVLTLTSFHVTLHHMLLMVDLCVAWHLRRTSTFSLACAEVTWFDMGYDPSSGNLGICIEPPMKMGKGKMVMGHRFKKNWGRSAGTQKDLGNINLL